MHIIAAGIALAAVAPAYAQRQRVPPPEPSQDPWVSGIEGAELQSAIAAYQHIASAGGWSKLPDRITLRLVDTPLARQLVGAGGRPVHLEFCRLVAGVIVVRGDDGSERTFRAGDAFVSPAGFTGTWDVLEPAKKLYAFYE